MKSHWRLLIVLLVLVLLILRAAELRLVHLQRPFWEDEVHHNYAILISGSFTALLKNIKIHYQPCLDYVVRMLFWFPLFGHQELSLRLPSLMYSLGTVAAAFGFSFVFFRRKGATFAVALALAFLAGWWIVRNPQEAYMAAEARHYSFAALLSLTWSAVYFLAGKRPKAVLFVAGLLLANSHFFSLPLIVTGYLLEAFLAFRLKNRRESLSNLGALGGILLITVVINFKALMCFLKYPPGQVQAPAFSEGVQGGCEVWLGFVRYLAIPLPALLFLILIIECRRHPAVRRLLVFWFGVLPALFIYMRLRSNYGFSPRYYTPFFGVGFVSVVLALDSVRQIFERNGKWQMASGKWQMAQATRYLQFAIFNLQFAICNFLPLRLSVFLGLCLPAGYLAMQIHADRDKWALPSANFSPYCTIYEELKRERQAMLILHTCDEPVDIPLLYLTFIGSPCRGDCRVISCVRGMTDPAAIRRSLDAFISSHPNGVIVLDKTPPNWTANAGAATRGHGDTAKELPVPVSPYRPISASHPAGWLHVQELRSVPGLIWKVRGMRNLDEVGQVAAAIGFQSLPGLFK